MLSYSFLLELCVQVLTAPLLLPTYCHNRALQRTLCSARNPSCSSQPKSKGLWVGTLTWPKEPTKCFSHSLSPLILSVSPLPFFTDSLSKFLPLSEKKKKKVYIHHWKEKKKKKRKREQWSKGMYNWGKEEATTHLGPNYLDLSEQLLHLPHQPRLP